MQLKQSKQANQNKTRQEQMKMITDVEQQIFNYLGLKQNYVVNEIIVNQLNNQTVKTIYIQSSVKTNRVFYLGHGFGGTSLMYFPLFKKLLEKGSIVLWQIRGMGLISKIQYQDLHEENIMKFYKNGLLKVLQYYNHEKIVFVSHSFGAYITLRFLLKYSSLFNIQKCILLSSIGVTSKLKDYKYQFKGIVDIYHYIYSWFAWKFSITYKSFLQHLYQPLKLMFFRNSFSKFSLNQHQLLLTCKLFNVLTHIRGGSEKYFFKLFEPRVLPKLKHSIQEMIEEDNFTFQTIFYYGGQADWVDKQGSQALEKKSKKFKSKILNKCGHMLPLHIRQLQEALQQQFKFDDINQHKY